MHGLVKNHIYEDYHHLGEYLTNVYDLLWRLNLKKENFISCEMLISSHTSLSHYLICTQGCFQILGKGSFIVRFLKIEK
jgi:hypothetical protein